MFWPSNPKHGVLFSCFILLLDFPWVVFAGICPNIQFFLEPPGSGSHQSFHLSMPGTFWSGKGLRAGLKAHQQMVLGWNVTGLSFLKTRGNKNGNETKSSWTNDWCEHFAGWSLKLNFWIKWLDPWNPWNSGKLTNMWHCKHGDCFFFASTWGERTHH